MLSTVYAGDLARDLGFPGMTPEFWHWCASHGIQGTTEKPFAFDLQTVESVIRSLRATGSLPKQRRKGVRK